MLMNQAMFLLEKLIDEIKDAPPEERDHFNKISLGMIEMGIEAFRTNPDFRRNVAQLLDREIRAYLNQN